MRQNSYWARFRKGHVSRRRLLAGGAVAGASIAAAAVIGCGDDEKDAGTDGSSAGAQVKRGGTYRFASSTNYPQTYDPHITASGEMRRRANSKLFGIATGPGVLAFTSRTTPDAAESLEQPDPLTAIIRIKSNVRFGEPVNRNMTTADVAYSFDRFVGKVPGVARSPEATETIRILESWRAVDDRIVRMTLKQPQANFAYRLGSNYTPYLMPEESRQAYNPATTAVAVAHWRLDHAVTNSLIRFRRNPDWHQGPDRPYMDFFEMYFLHDYTARLFQFRGGNLDDITAVAGGDLETLKRAISGVQFVEDPKGDPVPMQAIAFLGIDPGPWRDPRVRQALSMALDRDAMTEAAYELKKLQGLGVGAKLRWNSFVPAVAEEEWLDPKGEGPNKMNPQSARYFKYDPEGAKKLLAEAGVADGFRARLWYPNTFSASFNTMAELTAQYASRVGIRLELKVADISADYPKIRTGGQYDGLALLPYGSFLDSGELLTNMFMPGGGRNNSVLNGLVEDPDLVRRIGSIESNLDANSRRQQILDIQNYLAEKMYYVPSQLGTVNTINAFQPWVRNVAEYRTINGVNEPWYWLDK